MEDRVKLHPEVKGMTESLFKKLLRLSYLSPSFWTSQAQTQLWAGKTTVTRGGLSKSQHTEC